MKAVYLHKRDFRFFDNEVLHWLNENQTEFLPVYFWEPSLMRTYEFCEIHQYAVLQALDGIRVRYIKQDIHLLECVGEAVSNLDLLYRNVRFETLVSHMEHGTEFTFQRDLAIKNWCESNRVRWIEFPSCSVKRGLKSRDERPAIWRAHMDAPLRPVPQQLRGLDIPARLREELGIESKALSQNLLKTAQDNHFFDRFQKVNERAAHEDLQDFLNHRSIKYRGGISSPNSAMESGSRLSVHLAWGTLSVRCIQRTTAQKMRELTCPLPDGIPTASHKRHYASLKSFSARIHWRDHFIQRLEDQPSMPNQALNSAFEHIPFEQDCKKLDAWIKGETGEPMVDACMRCLKSTGFLNFRMRSMCLSYGVYALHLDWRILGQEMAKLFYDYEPGIHWSQVQMQAGVVGINTIRVYSPAKQLLDQDPDCVFIKKWIPELTSFHANEIKNYSAHLANLCPYPAPIVDFKARSATMKTIIYGIKNGSENRQQKSEVFRRHGSRVLSKKRSPKSKPQTLTLPIESE
jgi:deoxyribodipyrimidine photo-lyase